MNDDDVRNSNIYSFVLIKKRNGIRLSEYSFTSLRRLMKYVNTKIHLDVKTPRFYGLTNSTVCNKIVYIGSKKDVRGIDNDYYIEGVYDRDGVLTL